MDVFPSIIRLENVESNVILSFNLTTPTHRSVVNTIEIKKAVGGSTTYSSNLNPSMPEVRNINNNVYTSFIALL
jgi:hypothetical protein